MLRENYTSPIRNLERAYTTFLMDFINTEVNPQHLDLLRKDSVVNIRIKIIFISMYMNRNKI